ncbi:Fic family protein [Cellulomonas sp.]|uniref:type II toxin-antitoxin system death-on-curing family toxin n=1 Tax=Cellulomonas sp. TaxID=40001 RepID=UPI00258F4077|nr:Fic family protein [Cellulomonas sp.]MCR6690111.1 Fic family protein [Cellulomonas sp.]
MSAVEPGVVLPTIEVAVALCERHGWLVRDIGSLASALSRPGQVVWGTEAYTGLHAKAAALLDALNRSHPLLDGNKRLAWTLVAATYRVNGFKLVAAPHDIDRFMREVGGDEHLGLDEIQRWLSEHCASVENTFTAPA